MDEELMQYEVEIKKARGMGRKAVGNLIAEAGAFLSKKIAAARLKCPPMHYVRAMCIDFKDTSSALRLRYEVYFEELLPGGRQG